VSREKRPGRRRDYVRFRPVTTRWMDNDIFGHVNNVHYYSWFDTAINAHLVEEGGFDPWNDRVVGYCVESGCRYHRPVRWPEPVEIGLRVGHLGNSSVRYECGVFLAGEEEARAEGHFVHVFVDRTVERPVPIPDPIRRCLEAIRRMPAESD